MYWWMLLLVTPPSLSGFIYSISLGFNMLQTPWSWLQNSFQNLWYCTRCACLNLPLMHLHTADTLDRMSAKTHTDGCPDSANAKRLAQQQRWPDVGAGVWICRSISKVVIEAWNVKTKNEYDNARYRFTWNFVYVASRSISLEKCSSKC